MLTPVLARPKSQSQTASGDDNVRDQALKQAGSQKQVLAERLEQHPSLRQLIQRLSFAPSAGKTAVINGKESLQFPQPEAFSFELSQLLWPGMRMDSLCAAVFPEGVPSGTALGAKVNGCWGGA